MNMKTKIIFLLLFSAITITATQAQKGNKKNNKKITISGFVVDGTQRPIANAIIMIDDEKTSKFTDNKGFYKIKVKSDVNKIGIFTLTNGIVEEPVNARTRINFTFTGSVPDQLNGEVLSPGDEPVNVGYATVRKKDLTNSVGQIDVTESKYSSYHSIYDVLKGGAVPGVQVSGSSIRIQGASSLMLSTEPLFVVDGVPVETVDDIQPVMVKSIQVLKGSAASIYGSRGANGVILINLIKGKSTR